MRLADAGIHLFIEKPLSTRLTGSTTRADVQQRGLVTNVAYVYRAHPVLQSMRQAIQDGDSAVLQSSPSAAALPRSIGRRTGRRTNTNRATGGGAIQDAPDALVNAVEWTSPATA